MLLLLAAAWECLSPPDPAPNPAPFTLRILSRIGSACHAFKPYNQGQVNAQLQTVVNELLPLAASPQLSGNSRLGFRPVASTSCLASGFAISSHTLGLSGSLYDGRIGSRSTGKERDTESGNDYFSARYYSSAMGRFMSPDPIIQNDLRLLNPQRWNKYAYVINNPLILTDPTGKDAVYVNFSGMAGGFGHSGVMSVHSDGSATFSYKDGEGQIHMDDSLPKVQFDSNGTPTADSYASLAKAVADFDTAPGQAPIDPASVGFVYFKTTDSETANLDQYIAQHWGNQEKYRLIGKSCLDYAVGGLNAAGVTNRVPYAKHFAIPNNLWLWLEPQGDDSNSRPLKEKVTHRICDENGQNCH
jgi:RHS repeat-associated protein